MEIENRSNTGNESRSNTGNESRSNTGNESRSNTGNESRSNTGNESRSNTGNESRSNTGNESRSNMGNENKSNMENASRLSLLREITELEFIGVELNLFLDTHPDNVEAHKDFNAYSAQLNALLKEYNEKYGPLLGFAFQPMAAPDSWVNTPWPWQNK